MFSKKPTQTEINTYEIIVCYQLSGYNIIVGLCTFLTCQDDVSSVYIKLLQYILNMVHEGTVVGIRLN